MPLIDRGTTIEGIPVSRALYGDDKVRAAVREGRRISERLNELLDKLVRARFEVDPSDGEKASTAVAEINELSRTLRNLSEDLRLYTEVSPDTRVPFPEE